MPLTVRRAASSVLSRAARHDPAGPHSVQVVRDGVAAEPQPSWISIQPGYQYNNDRRIRVNAPHHGLFRRRLAAKCEAIGGYSHPWFAADQIGSGALR